MLGLVLKAAAWELVSINVFLIVLLWTFAQFGYLVSKQQSRIEACMYI